jgi:hypothetical protein
MKIGLIARAEERGLGIQTKALYDWLEPERTLVVVPFEQDSNNGYDQNLSWYGRNATVVDWKLHELPEDTVRDWLDGLDVVLTCETFYDWDLVRWANEMGVATVCQVNPEFYRHGVDRTLPHPTVWWAPTTWRLAHLPDGTRVVPVPVEPHARTAASAHSGPLRILHVVGRKAMQDRNGTDSLLRSVHRVPHTPVELTIHVQSGEFTIPNQFARSPNVNVRVHRGSIRDRWAMYANQHLLVMPRRYGGLALAVQEAAMCGLGIVMTKTPPNTTFYPAVGVQVVDQTKFAAPCGPLDICQVHRPLLAGLVKAYGEDRSLVALAQSDAYDWACRHDWPSMLVQYRDELEHAASLAPTPTRKRRFRLH